jgi:hypothetical protein
MPRERNSPSEKLGRLLRRAKSKQWSGRPVISRRSLSHRWLEVRFENLRSYLRSAPSQNLHLQRRTG